ncbi:MAG TPA: hypothetical protein VM427_03525 [Patescibacteria group bacterium]|nr:hypothetical protein [Patescibacteria group bacterium]
MPSWRCPHCSTPQAEASRCWVCHRSSTSCGTCRNFRGSVAARFGFCGLDRHRLPLNGDEVRACWEDGAIPLAPEPAMPGLLDLLTVGALGEPLDGGAESLESAGPVGLRRPAAERTGTGRLWVEVEV